MRPRFFRSMRLSLLTLAALIALGLPARAIVLNPGDILVTDTTNGVFRIDPATGDRTLIASATVGTGPVIGFASAIDLTGDGDLIVGDGGSPASARIVRIDLNTGNRVIVSGNLVGSGPTIGDVLGGVIDTNGDLLFAEPNLNVILRVDLTTGDRSVFVGPPGGSGPALSDPFAIAFEANGDLLVTSFGDRVVTRVDSATLQRTIISGKSKGATPTVGTGPLLVEPQGLAVAPNGDILITDRDLRQLLLIDPATGDRTVISGGGVGLGPEFTSPRGILIDPSGDIFVADLFPGIFKVDPATGDRTLFSGPGAGIGPDLFSPIFFVQVPLTAPDPPGGPDNPVPPPNGVPEPTTLVLLATGLIALRLKRRRR